MKKWILLEKQKYFKGFGTLPDNLYMRGRTPPQELLFWSFFTPTQMLWHVRCDIAWNSLCANVTITRLIVTCELWHCLEQSLGQSHNQDFVWLWHWPKDSRRQCHMPHVTIRGLIVTLAQRLFQAMSQLTCHNQAAALYPINSKDVRLIFIRFSSHFHKIFVSSLFSLWSLF